MSDVLKNSSTYRTLLFHHRFLFHFTTVSHSHQTTRYLFTFRSRNLWHCVTCELPSRWRVGQKHLHIFHLSLPDFLFYGDCNDISMVIW